MQSTDISWRNASGPFQVCQKMRPCAFQTNYSVTLQSDVTPNASGQVDEDHVVESKRRRGYHSCPARSMAETRVQGSHVYSNVRNEKEEVPQLKRSTWAPPILK